MHVHAFQSLVKSQFPHIGGLQNTLLQLKTPIVPGQAGMSLQIVHARKNHWVCIQVTGSDIHLYDSAYSPTDGVDADLLK